MLSKSIAKEAGIQAFEATYGTVLIPDADVEAFVNKCEEKKISIYRIEAFHREGSYIVPDMDCIADFSSLSGSMAREMWLKSAQAARDFFASIQRSKDVLWEFELNT